MLHIWPHTDPIRDTNKKGMCLILHISGREDVCIGITYINQGLKSPPCLTMSDHAGIGVICNVHFLGWYTNVWRGCCVLVELCLAPELTLQYDQPEGDSSCPHQSFSANILTPKEGSIFILASIINISYQMNSRSLLGPFFAVWCTINLVINVKIKPKL